MNAEGRHLAVVSASVFFFVGVWNGELRFCWTLLIVISYPQVLIRSNGWKLNENPNDKSTLLDPYPMAFGSQRAHHSATLFLTTHPSNIFLCRGPTKGRRHSMQTDNVDGYHVSPSSDNGQPARIGRRHKRTESIEREHKRSS